MNITVITPPPFEPVTVAQAYEHLRWDPEEEGSPPETVYPLQGLIERNIATARDYVERATRRALVAQTIRLSSTSFGMVSRGRFVDSRCYLELLRPPLLEVLSVDYYDAANVLQPIDASDYYVTDDLVPRLHLVSGYSAPMFYARPDAARVTYRVGYAPEGSPPATQADYAATVPAALKDAILLQVQILSDRFDKGEREDLERARDNLLLNYRVHTFYA